MYIYLFFGTAHHIVLLVRERIETADLPPLRYLIADFRRVAGLEFLGSRSAAQDPSGRRGNGLSDCPLRMRV